MPTPTTVTPNTSPTSGGISVRIDGTNFVAGATVQFGGSPASNVSVSGGGTVITCTIPARPSGLCDIVVINPNGQSGSLTGGFMYSDPVPAIASVTPATGPTAGGTQVTITGSNFAAGAMVSFGAMPASGVMVMADTTITCHTPPHIAGGCDVMVTNPGGQTATLAAAFVYSDPAPAIASVTPATGPTAGGTMVTISGSNFAAGATVSFGGVPALAVNVTGTIISCTTPPRTAGGHDVTVTNPDGQTATLAAGFMYSDPVPTIAAVTPPTGPTAGGTMVTITGSNFAAGTTVSFGAMPASGVMVMADTTITCHTPPHIAGGCDVMVTNPGGQTATLAAAFVYSDPAPAIASVTPATGPTAGGTMVTISGSNFAAGATVSFGGVPALAVNVTGTIISCTTPPRTAGGHDVTVTNPDGQTATLAAGFMFSDPVPTIAAVTPPTGPTAGGTMVTITGSNFAAGTTVSFGAMPASGVMVMADTTITCHTPPHIAGGCDVMVTNPGGQTATLAAAFVYSDPAPAIASVTPVTGPTAGGTMVTISGSNFAAGATVSFGATPASGVMVMADTTITCHTPHCIAGGCDVMVTNPGGQTATLAAGFMYSDPVPAIASVTPATGPTAGGTQVTITGSNFAAGTTVSFGAMPASGVMVMADTTITCHTPPHIAGGCDVMVTNPGGQTATLAAAFVYSDPAPAIASVTPATGPTAGGTMVTISGSNFAAGATVSFGGVPALAVNVTGTIISCTTPPRTAGGHDVTVTNPDGQTATLAAGFMFSDPVPTIAAVTPPTGPTAGGTMVTITGSNFAAGTTVSFGAMPASGVMVMADTTITCHTPPHIAGGCDVMVTNPGGQTATLAAAFVYSDPAPAIASVTPATGPTAGGTMVTISGSNFAAGATVSFGGVPALAVNVTGTIISCTTPPRTAGGHDVTVTNPDGQTATLAAGFMFSDPVPTIAAVTPPTGPTAGGTMVTITGSNFAAGTTVSFGAMPASAVMVMADTTMTCTSPAHPAGTVDVIVFHPNGSSATLSAGFNYS